MVRLCAALVALPLVLPLHRLLADPETGLAGQATVAMVDIAYAHVWSGVLLVLLGAALLALLVPAALVERVLVATRRGIMAVPSPHFAALAALLTGLLVMAFTQIVLAGVPNHIDALTQLLHARSWQAGRLAIAPDHLEFWMIQNSLRTEHGWVSHYPPGHLLLLAIGLVVGYPAIIGAAAAAATVFFLARFADLAFPSAAAARVGVLLLAVSPFFIALSGSFMNHVTSAAAITGAAWLLARARGGQTSPLVGAGFALAFAFATRPLSALAAGAALLVCILGVRRLSRARTLIALLAGAAIPLALLFAYNAYFFGAPLRFGYMLALGPDAGLGFGRDPWGNVYGLTQATAYTAADLLTLNVHLLESPLPVLLVIASWLLVVRRLEWGAQTLLAWALVSILANALYWHHGQLFGPRMLFETAPAWLVLFALAVAALMRALPRHLQRSPGFAPRAGFVSAAIIAIAGGLAVLAPQRLAAYGSDWLSVARTPVPSLDQPALVFVHDSWRARVAMRLAAQGMRLDSVEAAIRGNSTCLAQQLADATDAQSPARATAALSQMNLRPRASGLPPLVELSPGNRAVILPNERLTPECAREVNSDRFGVLDLAPLVWRGALPNAHGDARPLLVRDLGPELNARIIAAMPDRKPFLYAVAGERQEPVLFEYAAGMRRHWSVP